MVIPDGSHGGQLDALAGVAAAWVASAAEARRVAAALVDAGWSVRRLPADDAGGPLGSVVAVDGCGADGRWRRLAGPMALFGAPDAATRTGRASPVYARAGRVRVWERAVPWSRRVPAVLCGEGGARRGGGEGVASVVAGLLAVAQAAHLATAADVAALGRRATPLQARPDDLAALCEVLALPAWAARSPLAVASGAPAHRRRGTAVAVADEVQAAVRASVLDREALRGAGGTRVRPQPVPPAVLGRVVLRADTSAADRARALLARAPGRLPAAVAREPAPRLHGGSGTRAVGVTLALPAGCDAEVAAVGAGAAVATLREACPAWAVPVVTLALSTDGTEVGDDRQR